MRVFSSIFLTAVISVALSNGASAANVTEVQGQVQLSKSGGPFTALTGPAVCNAGDVIRVVKDGSARVINPNGVVQTASPSKPIVCVAGPGPGGALPTTAAPAATPAAAAPAAAAASATGVSTGVLVGGAIAVGAGVAGVVALSNKKSSASP
jgi:hypothetical protein